MTQSHNILAFQQIAADESIYVILSAYQLMLEEQGTFDSNLLKEKYNHLQIEFFNLSNSKMLYALT